MGRLSDIWNLHHEQAGRLGVLVAELLQAVPRLTVVIMWRKHET
jgi:hypothetical protein